MLLCIYARHSDTNGNAKSNALASIGYSVETMRNLFRYWALSLDVTAVYYDFDKVGKVCTFDTLALLNSYPTILKAPTKFGAVFDKWVYEQYNTTYFRYGEKEYNKTEGFNQFRTSGNQGPVFLLIVVNMV